MKKIENIIGFAVLILSIVLGSALLKTDMLFFRWVIGMAFGYVLTRSFFGFAGSINRAYRTGSTKLMRALMLMFVLSAILTSAFLMFGDVKVYNLWINPINLGLIVGGILFGFGMSYSSCCATGTLTDLVTGLPRALITLLFFGIGVFVGFPLQARQSWIKESWFKSGTGRGVFLPDLFASEGKSGYLGAIILTALLAGIVVVISYMYESKRKKNNQYSGVGSEQDQDAVKELDTHNYKLFSETTYKKIFVEPWSLTMGAVLLSVLFTLLMGVTKAGWGASGPFGFWFGRLLKFFGMSVDSIVAFTGGKPGPYTMPFFENPSFVQNIGIIVGTLICLLLAGSFTESFKSELKIKAKDVLIFAIGGFAMGFGTRLSNGCNVGALYTPIANFSLSGWIFLICLVVGGSLGNYTLTMLNKKK
ncbi:YeeE/YedE family protein [Treponema sp. OMZ 788]|uniref:YeeE/YedE family protein n=1 Tax=Treponema sp. OMZ 788 TaxID=2563664 RepID=UPI0020A335F2|nr:YeeE/YedE family protein [Treponema sp. OMZ 788]UTC64414.1 YeeE/YedE family protein [Treponema sp. OMZ 788]